MRFVGQSRHGGERPFGAQPQRIRTECDLTVGPSSLFPQWKCGAPPDGEDTMEGNYMPTSIGALFGAR